MSALLPLRPLQQKAIDGLRDSLKSGRKRPIIQAPCGFGKTILASHIVAGALKKGNTVAFVVPFISLIDQALDRFRNSGVDVMDIGVRQGKHPMYRPDAPVQICSVQTMASRGWPKVSFAIVDECHLRFRTLDSWIDAEQDKIFVGLSATPWARGLKGRWNNLIIPTSIKELTEQGWLCPSRCFAPTHPDLSKVKTVAGDYHEGQLSALMSQRQIVGDVVETWLDKADRRPTLVFAVDRAHADELHLRFQDEGVRSRYVDALTPREQRLEIAHELRKGEVEVVCSVGTMTHGIDLDIRCIVLARPTKSEILYVQMVGRGLRIAEGKSDCLILDHSDTSLNLGLVADISRDQLRGGKADTVQAMERPTPKPRECPECHFVIPPIVFECPNCGYKPKRAAAVVNLAGELVEFEKARELKVTKKENRDWSYEDKAEFYSQLRGYGRERGYKDGWAARKYKEKFGVWPDDPRVKYAKAKACGKSVAAWIKSRMIAWAKATRSPRYDEAAAR